MKRRVFGLGALTAIAACVGTDPDIDADGGTPSGADASPESSVATDSGSESGGESDSADDVDAGRACPSSKTWTVQDFLPDPGWNPAKTPSPACTAVELGVLEANVNNSALKTMVELGTGLSAGCANCLITNRTALNWGLIVSAPDTTPGSLGGGKQGFYNFGACFGRVDQEDCGRAVQFAEYCFNASCSECAPGNERAKCVDDAQQAGGGCSAQIANVGALCANLPKANGSCGDLLKAAAILCGPNADGGT